MCRDIAGYLYLDSDDRNNKPNPDTSDVTFPVKFKGNVINRIGLSSYDFAVAFDNINERNRTMYIDDGTTTYPVTLEIQIYNIDELRVEAKIVLDALGLGAWTITVRDGKFIVLAPVPIKFLTNPVNNSGRDWADMMGMEKETELKLSHLGGIADIVYTNKLYIIADEIHQYKSFSDESSSRRINNALGVVYLNENKNLGNEKVLLSPDAVYPHRATRQIQDMKWIKHRTRDDVGVVRILLLDDRGETIPDSQKDNMRWSLELMMGFDNHGKNDM